MKKTSTITQWIFTSLFATCALGAGLHWATLLLIIGTVLMMPIPKLRKILNSFKLKNWLIITLAAVIFCVGMLVYPPVDVSSDPDEPAYSDTTTIDNSQNTNDSSSNSSNQGSSSNTGNNNSSNQGSSSDTENNNSSNQGSSSNTGNNTPSVGNGTSTPVDPSTLPAYSDTPYVVVNNNIPSFTSTELTTTGYESYSDLDSLGRCGVAIASCGKEIMPAEDEERGSISSIKPTGWIQAQYEGISGGYLWNRCHLIGWQLSAENANRQNLITGTRYMNTSGMLPFENMVADYIKETNNHVAYRVTPIFEGNNLVCSGIQIEAYSIEDNGAGIQFNVYCYNVQPGITIDYATGNSSSNSQSSGSQSGGDSNSGSSSSGSSDSVMVWIPSSGTKYHSISSCSNMKNPTQVTLEEAVQRGYGPCSRC